MDDKQANQKPIQISSTTGIFRKNTKVLEFKIRAPKELFILTDALAKHGSFPEVHTHVASKLESLVIEYLERANEIVSKASEIGKTGKYQK